MDREPLKVFTIGHSNHSIDDFLQLLAKHDIDVLVDARSSPFSKYSPHFNQDNLKLSVSNARRKYLFLGREVGGKPKDESFYDDRHVLYSKIAESSLFQQGIERLLNGIASYKVALLCGEENPSGCHRRNLIGRSLAKLAVEIFHIRGNGSVQTEEELLLEETGPIEQLSLFSTQASAPESWRSIQSVLPRKPQLD